MDRSPGPVDITVGQKSIMPVKAFKNGYNGNGHIV
jgi:hypothetical protein